MAGSRMWLVTLLAAALGTTACSHQPQGGFMVLQSEFWNCNPEPGPCSTPLLQHAISVNASGDVAHVTWDLREKKGASVVWLTRGGTQFALFPKNRTYSRLGIVGDSLQPNPQLRRICATTSARGNSTIQVSLRSLTGEDGEVWLSPELGCIEVKSVRRLDEAGSTLYRTTTSIVRGAPPPANLSLPADFKQIPAQEAYRRAFVADRRLAGATEDEGTRSLVLYQRLIDRLNHEPR